MIHPFHLETPKARLRVGQDLDGVHYSFDRWYFEAMVQLRHDHPCWDSWGESTGLIVCGRPHYKPATTWNFFEDLYGQTREEFTAVCNEAVDKGIIFTQGEPIAGGLAAWNDMRAQGHELHVITARSFGTHSIASEVATIGWLANNGFKYHSITFAHDKTTAPRVDVMLDDHLGNYDALTAAGVEVWLFDQPWNQDDGTRKRVYTHDEFTRRVNALAERRAAEQAEAREQYARTLGLTWDKSKVSV